MHAASRGAGRPGQTLGKVRVRVVRTKFGGWFGRVIRRRSQGGCQKGSDQSVLSLEDCLAAGNHVARWDRAVNGAPGMIPLGGCVAGGVGRGCSIRG